MKIIKYTITAVIISSVFTSCSTRPVNRTVNYPISQVRKEFEFKKDTDSFITKTTLSKNHIVVHQGSKLSSTTTEVKLKPLGKRTEVSMHHQHKLSPHAPWILRALRPFVAGSSTNDSQAMLDHLEKALKSPEINFIEAVNN